MYQPYAKLLLLLLLIKLTRCESEFNTNTNTNNTIASRNGSMLSLLSAEDTVADSGSIELPKRKQRSGQSLQHRPIVELVLGVLDTFHSSSKSELRRIKARRARQNDQASLALVATTTTTTTAPPLASRLLGTRLLMATPRKRTALIAARL